MMTTKTQQLKGQDGVLSSLNKAIDALNGAKEATSMTPAKAAFASAGILLAMIKVSFLPVHFCRFPANVYRTR